jgi:glycosyltransferase involved in cell wall biosynthesis
VTRGSDAPLVVAVEASRMAHDVRGIGRYVRALLPRLLAQRTALRLVLLVRTARDAEPMVQRLDSLGLSSDRVEVRAFRDVAVASADLHWYPWNIARPAPRAGPVVVTIHDVAPLAMPDPRRSKWLQNRRWRRLYDATARRATIIIADSEFTAAEVQRELGVERDRLRVVPLAADDFEIPPADRDEEALRRLGVTRPFVLAVGAVDRRKNLALLQRAMPAVVRSAPGATLVLVGPRSEAGATAGDPPWQRTVGFVSEADLATLYRTTRALVAPSAYEGFGLPVLEAMRLGAPAICARAASLPEVGGDAARYVEPHDEAQLTAAIVELLADDRIDARMRQASLHRAAHFSWDATARLTLDAFDEALLR